MLGNSSEVQQDPKTHGPRGLRVGLMPHQQSGLEWLLGREEQNPAGGLFADEADLGKSISMISLILTLHETDGNNDDKKNERQTRARSKQYFGGTLIVVPLSTIPQWDNELKHYVERDLLTIERYHGGKREGDPTVLSKKDVVLTTYNILSREFKVTSAPFKICWKRFILDDVHVIQNHINPKCIAVCSLNARIRWVLTGRPMDSREPLLFSVLKFLRCSPYNDMNKWHRWITEQRAEDRAELTNIMRSITLRRTHQDLQANRLKNLLPEKHSVIIKVKLDDMERIAYDTSMAVARMLIATPLLPPSAEQGSRVTRTKAQKLLSVQTDVVTTTLLARLLRLRQICCHVSLINSTVDKDDIEENISEGTDEAVDLATAMNSVSLDEGDDEIGIDKRVAEGFLTSKNPVFDPNRRSSKIRAVIAKVREITETSDKAIVVSQWVSLLDIVGRELDRIKNVSYRMFTSKVPVKDRQGIVDDFNSPQSETNVLLLSLTAGGPDLNLVGANHLLLIDIHWNPQLECQAQDRIYRIDQKKKVFIYKYICTDTIEERIKYLQERKMEIAGNCSSGVEEVGASSLTLDEMKSLFGM